MFGAATDQVSPAVNGGDPGDGRTGPTQFAGVVDHPGSIRPAWMAMIHTIDPERRWVTI
jgi:hypothetical protein